MSVPEFQRPSSDVLVWETLPKFFHPTIVPLGTEIMEGWNAKSTIRTFARACGDRASWEIAAVGPAIRSPHATAHANRARAFVIENLLRWLDVEILRTSTRSELADRRAAG